MDYRRDPIVRPSHDRTIPLVCEWVTIHHRFCQRPLFSFPAYFCPSLGERVVDYGLVMDACRIITNAAGNDAHLARIQSEERVPDDTIILAPGNYFYCLDGTNTDYAVVTEFAAWVFPHNSLPPEWRCSGAGDARAILNEHFLGASASAMSERVKGADGECIITKYTSMTQNTRIIPPDQVDWFDANRMEAYGLGNPLTGINNVANGMTLRCDVHLCLNQHNFVIRPEGNDYKMHMVNVDGNYSELLHWRLVEIPKRVSVEFLYARFAYTIINRLHKTSFVMFKAVEVPNTVKVFSEARLKLQQAKKRKLSSIPESTSGNSEISTSTTSNANNPSHAVYNSQLSISTELTAPIEDFFPDLDKRWRDSFIKRHPELVEESENPPDTRNDGHMETPRMLKLMSEYIRQNPQVWQSSTTPPGSIRNDEEGDYLRLMNFRTKYNPS